MPPRLQGTPEQLATQASICQCRIDHPEWTQDEIGVEHGVTKEYVRQVLKKNDLPTRGTRRARGSGRQRDVPGATSASRSRKRRLIRQRMADDGTFTEHPKDGDSKSLLNVHWTIKRDGSYQVGSNNYRDLETALEAEI